MTFISGIQAVIFDMDGVVIDSEPLHLLAFQNYFQKHGIEYTAEHNKEFLGRKDIVIAETLIARHGITDETPHTFVEKKEAHLLKLIKEQGQPRPGLFKVLDYCKQNCIPLAIASSATMPAIQLVVDTLGIRDYFETLTSGDEVANGKPAPDVFLLAAKRLGVEPKACLVIEDTLNGIKAAKAAGMQCVAIPCDATRHQDHSMADLQLGSLEELPIAEFTSR